MKGEAPRLREGAFDRAPARRGACPVACATAGASACRAAPRVTPRGRREGPGSKFYNFRVGLQDAVPRQLAARHPASRRSASPPPNPPANTPRPVVLRATGARGAAPLRLAVALAA